MFRLPHAGSIGWLRSPGASRPVVRFSAVLSVFVVTLAGTALAPLQAVGQAGGPWSNVGKGALLRAEVAGELEKVGSRLATIPANGATGGVDERVRRGLERRRSLLEELDSLIDRHEQLQTDLGESRRDSESLRKQAAAFDETGKPAIADLGVVTLQGLRIKEQEAAKLRETLDSISAALSVAAKRQAEAGEERSKLEARTAAAVERQKALEEEAKSAQGDNAAAVTLELANARLNESIARRAVEVMDAARDAAPELDAYRALAVETTKRAGERLERELAQYRGALRQQESSRRKQLEEQLAAKEIEAQAAEGPAGKMLADWEAKVLRARAQTSQLQDFAVVLSKEVNEQELRIVEDRTALERLRQYLTQHGSSGQVAQLVRNTLRQIPLKRKSLGIAVTPSVAEKLSRYRDLHFEVDNTLYDLTNIWRKDILAIREGLSEDAAADLRTRTARVRDELRGLLNTEKTALSDVIAQGQRLESLKLDRTFALDELDTFIRARVLWIRDRDPIGTETLRTLSHELQEFGAWTVRAGSPATLGQTYRDLTSSYRSMYLAVVFFVAPLIFFFVWRGLTQYARGREQQDAGYNRGAMRLAARVFVDLLRIVLFPAYVWFTAAVISSLGLPEGLGLVAASGLRAFAVLVFGRSLNRVLFRADGVFVLAVGIPAAVAAAIHRGGRVALVGFAALMIPWAITSAEPFEFIAVPRLALAGFALVVSFCAFRVFRPNSVVITHGVRGVTARVMHRRRGLWRVLFPVLVFASPVLYVVGYGFAALYIARAVGLSVIAAAVLPPLHRRVAAVVGRYQAHRRRLQKYEAEAEAAKTGDPVEEPPAIELTAIARWLFVLVSVYLFALIWGFDERAWQTLVSIDIWQAGVGADGPEFVTAADLVFAVGLVLATGWLLRDLPGIYDLTLFPRVSLDTGLRYAIVTMTRYGLVFIAAWWVTSTLKLDTARLGWLIAAMGVGLGFGLQEIVSNFVSGIILLVERPIRVGDQVTIGTVVGRVQRINIRATTVLNFDRQEVLVPNRALITQDVINWTLADSVTRLVVKIGVDYGSDIEQVRAILAAIATGDPEVLKDPAPSVVFVNHGESSLDFELRLFVSDVIQRVVVQDRVNTQINAELAAHGIGIPFPQRDLHVKSWPGGEVTAMPVAVAGDDTPTTALGQAGARQPPSGEDGS